jgi:hypothetical protein
MGPASADAPPPTCVCKPHVQHRRSRTELWHAQQLCKWRRCTCDRGGRRTTSLGTSDASLLGTCIVQPPTEQNTQLLEARRLLQQDCLYMDVACGHQVVACKAAVDGDPLPSFAQPLHNLQQEEGRPAGHRLGSRCAATPLPKQWTTPAAGRHPCRCARSAVAGYFAGQPAAPAQRGLYLSRAYFAAIGSEAVAFFCPVQGIQMGLQRPVKVCRQQWLTGRDLSSTAARRHESDHSTGCAAYTQF